MQGELSLWPWEGEPEATPGLWPALSSSTAAGRCVPLTEASGLGVSGLLQFLSQEDYTYFVNK